MKKSWIAFIIAGVCVLLAAGLLVYDYFKGTSMPYYGYIALRATEFGIPCIIAVIIGIILLKKEKKN